MLAGSQLSRLFRTACSSSNSAIPPWGSLRIASSVSPEETVTFCRVTVTRFQSAERSFRVLRLSLKSYACRFSEVLLPTKIDSAMEGLQVPIERSIVFSRARLRSAWSVFVA